MRQLIPDRYEGKEPVGSGGMASKVKTMWHLATTVQGLVIDLVGPDPHALRAVLGGGPNTTGTRLENIVASDE